MVTTWSGPFMGEQAWPHMIPCHLVGSVMGLGVSSTLDLMVFNVQWSVNNKNTLNESTHDERHVHFQPPLSCNK